MRSSLIVVGASNLDRICRLDMPMDDGASVPGRVTEFPGGAGLNLASNLSAFGVSVSLATILGSDTGSDFLRKAMSDRNIATHIQTVDGSCANYTAILQPNGDLVVAVNDMDIYRRFDTGELDDDISRLNTEDWLIADANLERSALETLSRCDCRFVALTVSAAKAHRLRDLGERIDLLFTNRREALALAGKDPGSPMSLAVSMLQALRIKRAIISDGPNPVMVLDGELCTEIAVPDIVAIQDVTGAGDALAAGTLCRLVEGEDLYDAVCTGIAAAQAILQVDGPWREDLADAIDSQSIQTMKAVRFD